MAEFIRKDERQGAAGAIWRPFSLRPCAKRLISHTKATDEKTFKVGDTVSYHVTGSLEGFPFAGTLVEVHADNVLIAGDPREPEKYCRGTRESRPLVDENEI